MRAKATRSTAVSVPECPRTTRRKLIIPRDRAAAEMFLAHPISRPLLASDRVPLHQVVQLARLHLLRAQALDLPQLGLVAGGVYSSGTC